MTRETELKFRLKKLPDRLRNATEITQIYLDFSNKETRKLIGDLLKEEFDWQTIKEIRIRSKKRKEQEKFYLTLKSDGTGQRDEYEASISASIFQMLKKCRIIGKIKKIRLEKKLPGLIAEIDEYHGKLAGLLIAEIEYDPENYPDKNGIIQLAEEYIGKEIEDVTAIKEYKNKFLTNVSSLEDLEDRLKSKKNENKI